MEAGFVADRLEDRVQQLDALCRLGEEVGVGEDAALGAAGGAGGVEERWRRVRGEPARRVAAYLVGDLGAARAASSASPPESSLPGPDRGRRAVRGGLGDGGGVLGALGRRGGRRSRYRIQATWSAEDVG